MRKAFKVPEEITFPPVGCMLSSEELGYLKKGLNDLGYKGLACYKCEYLSCSHHPENPDTLCLSTKKPIEYGALTTG